MATAGCERVSGKMRRGTPSHGGVVATGRGSGAIRLAGPEASFSRSSPPGACVRPRCARSTRTGGRTSSAVSAGRACAAVAAIHEKSMPILLCTSDAQSALPRTTCAPDLDPAIARSDSAIAPARHRRTQAFAGRIRMAPTGVSRRPGRPHRQPHPKDRA